MRLQQTSIEYDDSFFPFYHLCHYLPLTAGIDTLSRSLLKFKRGKQPDLNTWIYSALQGLNDIPLSPDTTIIRALSHNETLVAQSLDPQAQSPQLFSSEPGPSPLDRLGQTLAAHFHCHYRPYILRKSRPTLSNKGLDRHQRETQLKNVYSIAPEALAPQTLPAASPNAPAPLSIAAFMPASGHPPPFLLIDDIFTTGATIRAIIHTLRQNFPLSPLQIFTLAKADYTPIPGQPTP